MTKRKLSLSSLLFPLALLGAACASSPARSSGTSGDDLAELKARVVELQRKAAVNEVEMARLRQQVADLEARLGTRGGGTASPGRSGGTPVSPAGTAARRPAEPAPASGARSGQLRPPAEPAPERFPERVEVPAEIEEVDIDEPAPAPRQSTPPARTAPARPSTTRPAPQAPAVRPTAPEPVPAAPREEPVEASQPATQALYDRGYTLYHQGHFVDAEASFQRFLQGSPGGELADNAQYWIGECRYARGDMRGALAAFRETVERYPEGNKVSDALLKAGQCLESLGDREGARLSYREVIRRFPGTAAAAVAQERQARLR